MFLADTWTLRLGPSCCRTRAPHQVLGRCRVSRSPSQYNEEVGDMMVRSCLVSLFVWCANRYVGYSYCTFVVSSVQQRFDLAFCLTLNAAEADFGHCKCEGINKTSRRQEGRTRAPLFMFTIVGLLIPFWDALASEPTVLHMLQKGMYSGDGRHSHLFLMCTQSVKLVYHV